MNPLKFWLTNYRIKKERKKEQEREEHFKKVNKEKKNYVCQLRGCKNKLKGLTYKCPYCHKEFCEEHRLPENHKCKNPRKPKEMKRGYGTKYSFNTSRIEYEKEMN
jgi:predicted nucleic acid binding AN1-type Zn finger protein